MKLHIPVIVEVPDDATHYHRTFGDSPKDYGFYKMRMIGVGGEHWFTWTGKEWKMTGHHKPHFIEEIPEEWKK